MGDAKNHIHCLSVTIGTFIGMASALYFLGLPTRAPIESGYHFGQRPSSWREMSQLPPGSIVDSTIPDWHPPASSSNWTLYVIPEGGIGNVLRTVASALTVARREGFDVKIVFRRTAFGSLSWGDFFLKPELGEINSTLPSSLHAREDCRAKRDHEWESLVEKPMLHVGGENLKCVSTSVWKEKPFPQSVLWFYRSLVPSQKIQQDIQQLQMGWRWHEFQWVGVHVRRSDNVEQLRDRLHEPDVKDEDMFPIEDYISLMKLATKGMPNWPTHIAPPLHRTAKPIRYFLATDNEDMRERVVGAFPAGKVVEFEKDHLPSLRKRNEGLESAVIDLFLLSACDLLIGTPASSFSASANQIGGQLFWEPRFYQ